MHGLKVRNKLTIDVFEVYLTKEVHAIQNRKDIHDVNPNPEGKVVLNVSLRPFMKKNVNYSRI